MWIKQNEGYEGPHAMSNTHVGSEVPAISLLGGNKSLDWIRFSTNFTDRVTAFRMLIARKFSLGSAGGWELLSLGAWLICPFCPHDIYPMGLAWGCYPLGVGVSKWPLASSIRFFTESFLGASWKEVLLPGGNSFPNRWRESEGKWSQQKRKQNQEKRASLKAGRVIRFGWWAQDGAYRCCIIKSYNWNLYNVLYQCHPNAFN